MKTATKKASDRVTPSDIKTPEESYDDKIKIAGGMPPTKKIDAIDAVNMPSGRKRAKGSVGF